MINRAWLGATAVIALIGASQGTAQSHGDTNTSRPWEFSNAASVSNRASLEVSFEPKRAMYLFTAQGEKPWIPGWDPAILKGDGYKAGSVFASPEGIFVTVDFNTETRRIFYTYVSPVEASTIELNFEANGKGGSTVNIEWNSTALSTEGNAQIAKFDQEALEQRARDWQELIETTYRDDVRAFMATVTVD